jgi:hypothetical protein
MYAVDFAVDIPRWLRDEGKEIFEHGTPSEGSWARSEQFFPVPEPATLAFNRTA